MTASKARRLRRRAPPSPPEAYPHAHAMKQAADADWLVCDCGHCEHKTKPLVAFSFVQAAASGYAGAHYVDFTGVSA